MQNLLSDLPINNAAPQVTTKPKISGATLTQDTDYQLPFKKIERWDMKKVSLPTIVIALFLALLAGSATGFGASNLQTNSPANDNDSTLQQKISGEIKNGDIFGSDSKNFKDSAEGYIEKGGVDGEGSHKLLRPGGVSQTVYLISSVVDLDKFAGMQTRIGGETYQGQKAGWLMDVGKVEILDTQATSPVTAK